jgi:hypothetical protein
MSIALSGKQQHNAWKYARSGNISKLKTIITRDNIHTVKFVMADKNILDALEFAVFVTIHQGPLISLKYILDLGISPNNKIYMDDRYCNSLLYDSVQYCKYQTLRLLIMYVGLLSIYDRSLIYHSNGFRCIKILLQYGSPCQYEFRYNYDPYKKKLLIILTYTPDI